MFFPGGGGGEPTGQPTNPGPLGRRPLMKPTHRLPREKNFDNRLTATYTDCLSLQMLGGMTSSLLLARLSCERVVMEQIDNGNVRRSLSARFNTRRWENLLATQRNSASWMRLVDSTRAGVDSGGMRGSQTPNISPRVYPLGNHPRHLTFVLFYVMVKTDRINGFWWPRGATLDYSRKLTRNIPPRSY